MNVTRIFSVGLGVLAVAGIAAGAVAIGVQLNAGPAAEPTPTPTAVEIVVDTARLAEIREEIAERQAGQVATFEAERAARVAAEAEAARVEAERIAAEEAARQAEAERATVDESVSPDTAEPPVEESQPQPPAALCPGGSVSVGFDGYNDTGCLPAECMTGEVDPTTRPECATPFRP